MAWWMVAVAFARPGQLPPDAPKVPPPPQLCEGLTAAVAWVDGRQAQEPGDWGDSLSCTRGARVMQCDYAAPSGQASLDVLRGQISACLTLWPEPVAEEQGFTWRSTGRRVTAQHAGERVTVAVRMD